MPEDKSLFYQRKPVKAVRKGDNYQVTDGLGKSWDMAKKEFEALFEEVPVPEKEVKKEDKYVR